MRILSAAAPYASMLDRAASVDEEYIDNEMNVVETNVVETDIATNFYLTAGEIRYYHRIERRAKSHEENHFTRCRHDKKV